MVPDFIRRRFITKKETLAPNAGFGKIFTRTFGMESYGLTAQNISKALNPEMVSEIKQLHKGEIVYLFT